MIRDIWYMLKRWWKYPRGKNQPLRVDVTRTKLVISIGINTLAFAAEHNPELYSEAYRRAELASMVDGTDIKFPETYCKVVDKRELANDIARVLQGETEDGSTPLCFLLDAAQITAMEDGSLAFAEDDD